MSKLKFWSVPFVFLLTFVSLSAQAQGTKDTECIKELDSVKRVSKLLTDSAKVYKAKIDSLQKLDSACNDCTTKVLKKNQVYLVYMPIALFLLFVLIFIIWISRSGFTLEDALSTAPTKEQIAAVQIQRSNAEQITPGSGTDIPDPKPQRSVSRLMAFLTGVIAIVIAVCLVSYQAYAIFAGCGSEKQFDALWKILAALGIGVIPYGINVWNGNAKEQTKTQL